MTGRYDDRSDEQVVLDIGALELAESERQLLAALATYESKKEEDFRYWSDDPNQRVHRLRRWQEIANAFHPNPWSTERLDRPPHRRPEPKQEI